MEISIQHPAKLRGEDLGTSVVIDVLRATTTATVLCARGAPRIFSVDSTEELARMTESQPDRYLVVSELDEIPEGPNRIDNSPVTASAIDLGERIPILVTTNGTRALFTASRYSEEVLLGCFLNLGSVVEYLRRSGAGRVTLLPAGKFADASDRVEDDSCAQVLKRLLRNEEPSHEEARLRIRQDAIVQRRLARPGFAADLELALTLDLYDVVPVARRSERDHSISIAPDRLNP